MPPFLYFVVITFLNHHNGVAVRGEWLWQRLNHLYANKLSNQVVKGPGKRKIIQPNLRPLSGCEENYIFELVYSVDRK